MVREISTLTGSSSTSLYRLRKRESKDSWSGVEASSCSVFSTGGY